LDVELSGVDGRDPFVAAMTTSIGQLIWGRDVVFTRVTDASGVFGGAVQIAKKSCRCSAPMTKVELIILAALTAFLPLPSFVNVLEFPCL
jgi:hypothetical protein